jgi:hypothetical protein
MGKLVLSVFFATIIYLCILHNQHSLTDLKIWKLKKNKQVISGIILKK